MKTLASVLLRDGTLLQFSAPYMPAGRLGVTNAVDSMVQHSVYREALNSENAATARDVFRSILDYNHYDCLSIWKLQDWPLNPTR